MHLGFVGESSLKNLPLGFTLSYKKGGLCLNLARFRRLEPAGAPERDRRIRFRGFRKLPLRAEV